VAAQKNNRRMPFTSAGNQLFNKWEAWLHLLIDDLITWRPAATQNGNDVFNSTCRYIFHRLNRLSRNMGRQHNVFQAE
jgi:hypothetical protein